jgi:hypothetical protein
VPPLSEIEGFDNPPSQKAMTKYAIIFTLSMVNATPLHGKCKYSWPIWDCGKRCPHWAALERTLQRVVRVSCAIFLTVNQSQLYTHLTKG